MLENLSEIDKGDLRRLSDNEFRAVASKVLTFAEEERRLWQIKTYKPASERVMKVHESTARLLGVGGGNGSSKTESVLVDMIATATGVFPDCMEHLIDQKFRGPINCRVIVESLTTTLHNIILPKLRWNSWTGVDMPGGKRGHWGWIPRDCLLGGSWDKAWSEKLRTLTVLCRDPRDQEKIIGQSTIQFMSHDNDPSDFASGDFHYVMMDEPPKHAIFVENEARTMRVNGKIVLAMTWPDDPSIPVDWIFDKIYEPAKVEEDIDWFELVTTENWTLDQKAISAQMKKWDQEMISVRIQGKPIRFSHMIHPLFTDTEEWWSFKAGKKIYPVDGKCPETGSDEIINFNHVQVLDYFENINWPCIFLLDPHPRKPHMFLWFKVSPADDIYIIADGKIDDTPAELTKLVNDIELELHLHTRLRLIDPNMGLSPGSATKRGVTWRDEFANAGLYCELADDGAAGRTRINTFLKPDPKTWMPRMHFHPRCSLTIAQMKRYAWDEYRRSAEKDQKQVPRDKNDDFPTLIKYGMNQNPEFNLLVHGAPVLHREGMRDGY